MPAFYNKTKQFKCVRCGHKWNPRRPGVPLRCAGTHCKSPYWNVPAKGTPKPETKEFEEVR